MAKTKTSNTVKAGKTPKVAKAGDLKSRKFISPLSLLITATLVLLLTIVGCIGYLKYTEHNLKAKAASWSYVGTYYGARNATNAYACKTRVDGPFGAVYKTQVLFSNVNPVNSGAWAYAASYRSGHTINSSYSTSWWGGKVTIVTVYASIAAGDTVGGMVSYSSEVQRPNFFNVNPANVANC